MFSLGLGLCFCCVGFIMAGVALLRQAGRIERLERILDAHGIYE